MTLTFTLYLLFTWSIFISIVYFFNFNLSSLISHSTFFVPFYTLGVSGQETQQRSPNLEDILFSDAVISTGILNDTQGEKKMAKKKIHFHNYFSYDYFHYIFNIFVIIALDDNSVWYLINLMSTILIILAVTSILRLFFILFSLSFILFVILFNYSNVLYIRCFSL